MANLIPAARIERHILMLRGHKVILDYDLAQLYGATTKRLNEQVKRNPDRFPPDFMFRLNAKETNLLRSQIATSNAGRGGRRNFPFAFTEHGALMVASILSTPIAVRVSLQVVRTFMYLREMLTTHKALAHKLSVLEKKYDSQFQVVFDAIRELMAPPPEKQKRRLGFFKD